MRISEEGIWGEGQFGMAPAACSNTLILKHLLSGLQTILESISESKIPKIRPLSKGK